MNDSVELTYRVNPRASGPRCPQDKRPELIGCALQVQRVVDPDGEIARVGDVEVGNFDSARVGVH